MKVNYKFLLNAEKVTPVIFTATEEYTTQKGVVLVKDSDGTIFNKQFIDIFYEDVEEEKPIDLEEKPKKDHPNWVSWAGKIVHLEEGDFVLFKGGFIHRCHEPFLLSKTTLKNDVDAFMKKEAFIQENLPINIEENGWLPFNFKGEDSPLKEGDKIKLKNGETHLCFTSTEFCSVRKRYVNWVEDINTQIVFLDDIIEYQPMK